MSTVAEIEAAIAQLPPEDFRALKVWIAERSEQASGMWSPAQLAAVAQQMVDEPDPARAEMLKEQIMRGFYGDSDA